MTNWQPTHTDPLFILAMDHRDSFGSKLFGVTDDQPDDEQLIAMQQAKELIFSGLQQAAPALVRGRAGVLVDEQYGQGVIDDVTGEPRSSIVLAVPIEASGHDWFTLQWGEQWLAHVESIKPAYAKVLVRDNPDFPDADRGKQFEGLARVSFELSRLGVPLLYELLVPATDEQLAGVGGDSDTYDRELRPDLVTRVLADNQDHGIEPTLWKVEGLETVQASQQVADQAKAGGRTADLIVLGRDAPAERLNHWLEVASEVEGFVGFAIGRSIWEDVISEIAGQHLAPEQTAAARTRIADTYLAFADHWVAR